MKKKKKEEEIWSSAFWGSEIGIVSLVEWFRLGQIMNDPKCSDLAVLTKDGGEGFGGGVPTEAVDGDLAVGGGPHRRAHARFESSPGACSLPS